MWTAARADPRDLRTIVTPVCIIGCGDIGRRVAELEHQAGNPVTGLVRSMESAELLRPPGIGVFIGDLDCPDSLAALPLKDAVVYYLAPPPPHGTADSRMEGFVSLLDAAHRPRRVVLLSTTGVYGDCGGEWVTEDRPPRPQADRTRRRLAAENTLRGWGDAAFVPVVILRVAGIYGPGRLPARRLHAGRAVLRESESPFSNRIHADDLARACLAAAARGRGGAAYNVSDGHPTTMTDYFNQVADLLGIPRPPQIGRAQASRQLSEGMASYLAESKRIDNRRMREELGIEPLYPDLASGLPACVGPHGSGHE